MSPNSAIARPNCRRSFAYFVALASARRAPEMLRVPSLTRPKFRMLNATLWPSPIVPSTFSTGTFTSSSISAVVDDPSSPSFSRRPAHHPHRALDEERGELLAVDLGEDGEQIGEAAVRDPHLLAVEQIVPAVVAEHGGGLRGERVRPRLRLGERVGADHLAARQPRQIFRLLRLVAEVDGRQRADRRVRANRAARTTGRRQSARRRRPR